MKISEEVFAQLPATSQWYQIMLQDPSVHFAASQQDKIVSDQQPSSAGHIVNLTKFVHPSSDVFSIKDDTPKKSRLCFEASSHFIMICLLEKCHKEIVY